MKFTVLNESRNRRYKRLFESSKVTDEDKAFIREMQADLRTRPVSNPNVITNALDKALKNSLRALRAGSTPGAECNVLLVGDAGVGKTAIVRDWCEMRGLQMVMKNASGVEKSDMTGITAREVDAEGRSTNTVTRLSNREFDALENPRAVLFLDELNRADKDSIASFLTLILDHKIPDISAGGEGMHKFPFLFTIAACNPSLSGAYETNDLDPALLNRFKAYRVKADKVQYRNYLDKKLEKTENELLADGDLDEAVVYHNMRKLAQTILNSNLFHFSTTDEVQDASIEQRPITSPRSFSAVIRDSEGNKDILLDSWNDLCDETMYGDIEAILSDYAEDDVEDAYPEVNDKATSALDFADELDGAESTFGQASLYDKLGGSSIIDDLDTM